ncbi:MAG: hypothetical protein WCB04_12895 [Mycobacteriales bacterium]
MSDTTARWRSAQALLPVALLVLVAALVVAAVLLGLPLIKGHRADAARTEAMHAARQESINLVTLDFNRVDADIANVLAGATGDFRDQYSKDADRVKKVVKDNNVRSTGSVLESGVVTSDTDSVTVLVVVDSTVRNKANTKGQLRHYRMQLEMSRVGGHWRASSLQFVT